MRKAVTAAVAITSLVIGLTACSSSKSGGSAGGSSSGGGGGSAASGTIKIGVVSDLSGPASSAYKTTEKGVEAYLNGVNAAGGVNGQKISYVMADTTSTVAGALSAAQKLVQSDKVFAVIGASALFFGATAYLQKQGIPIIGQGSDGPEWVDQKNTDLFAWNLTDYSKVYSTYGDYFKARGATSCASLGYADSPSSTSSAKGTQASCVAAGLKDGYITGLPTGSTDVGAIAIAMKNANVDAVNLPIDPSTGFALATALRQNGVSPKSLLFATGYGGDLLSDSAATASAQGFQFASQGEPVELNTPATQTLVKNLASAGVTTTPTFAEQSSYLSTAAFVAGLKAAGANPTPSGYIKALRGVSDFDGDGLLAPLKVSFSSYSPAQTCLWAVSLQGKKFVPEAGTPTCGKAVS
jgi:branched-chain amino acid transport system substrate-binding protein